jgi:PAS domain S-box-containing protein
MASDTVPRARGDICAALERLPLPAAVIGSDWTVEWLNDAAQRLLGDVVGERFTVMFSPESERAAREAFTRKLVGGAAATEYEAVFRTKDGTRLVAEVSSVVLEDGGSAAGVFGVAVPERELPPIDGDHLTPRQAQVLHRLAAGDSTDQIAARLGISRETVRNHIRDILKRLGVHSRLEAVVAARERGLL